MPGVLEEDAVERISKRIRHRDACAVLKRFECPVFLRVIAFFLILVGEQEEIHAVPL